MCELPAALTVSGEFKESTRRRILMVKALLLILLALVLFNSTLLASQEMKPKDERFKDLPIIAMTVHAMAGDEDKSLQSGMNGHITKPIDPDQMFATLQKWILLWPKN